MSAKVRLQARNPAASFLVQAPAGSGKTELLTQRILRLLAVVDAPEEILALTFTRKAAAEMRGRVLEALAMTEPVDPASHKMDTWRLAQAALARSNACGWHLEKHPSRLRMMTLDSFTHALASQMPLLSGFGRMPAACNYPLPLYREAAELAVEKMILRSPDRAAVLLLHQDHNSVALINLVAAMLGRRDQWLRDVQLHAEDTHALRAVLEDSLFAIMDERLQQCDALMPAGAKQELPALLAFAGSNRGDDDLAALSSWPAARIADLSQWQRLLAELMTANGLRKPGGINVRRGFPAAKEHAATKQQFQQWLEQLAEVDGLEESFAALMTLPAEPRFAESQWQVLESLFSLLLAADTRLQRLFEQRGEADFIEIALRAMRALEDEAGNPTDLLLKLDYRIHHILVDEFQDTSLLQIRLLQSLTAGWQAADGYDRSLFMVGDPMQSIYRFRKAEVGLFLLASANRAGLPEVEKLTLERNFRSAPAIVDWVNRAFATIFPDEPDILLGAVEHAAADAALDHAGVVRLSLQQDDEQEAAAVVEAVRQELGKRTPAGKPQRIAILARSRKHLHSIMPALTAASIAYKAIDILPLNRRPEIRQMRALLRALLHAADRESWAALLRGPCCGLSTQALHGLLSGDMRPVLSTLSDETRLAGIDADARDRVRFLIRALAPSLQAVGRVPLRGLLTCAWQRMGMPGLLSPEATGNIDAMLALIDELEEGGSIVFSLLDERLEKLYAEPSLLAGGDESPRVELLTMHGAKGLQWDVVILPGLGKKGSNSDTPVLAFADVPVQEGVHPLIAVRAAVRSSDAVYDLVRDVEKKRENNELARLLYVACTRAETTLLMFGEVSEKSGQAAAGSLLKLLLPDGIEDDCFGADRVEATQSEATTLSAKTPLLRMCSLPLLPDDLPVTAESETEYFWAGAEAAPVGNAMHAALQHVAECGIERWQAADSAAEVAQISRLLMAEGLSGRTLSDATARCEAALTRVLASNHAKRILSGEQSDAHCEWALSSHHGGFISHHVIDRSFIDADGVRWIIDYKTASHEGGDLQGFLAEESARHAPQLQRYAAILGELEPQREIRAALYFPMLDALCEVPSAPAIEGESA